MVVWLLAVLIPWAAICLVWGSLLLAQIAARRRGLFLVPRSPAADRALPSVCVVVPARNEAERIAPCLDALLAHNYPLLTIVVADDRSDDDTPNVIRRYAAADDRVRHVRIDELPAGWMGKSHALWAATRALDSDWLLFLDADCVLERDALNTAMLEALERQAELLTLWPRQASGGFWERLTIPLCAGIIALWFRSAGRGGSKRAFANGQFLLIKRCAYERIGGHRAVRSALIEDIPLAELARQRGVRGFVACGRDLVTVRMYDSYQGIRDGWARIFVGALRSPAKLGVSVAWLLVGSLLPFVALPALAITEWLSAVNDDRGDLTWMLLGLAVAHLSLIAIVSYRFWGFGGCDRRYLWLYPLSVLVVVRILVLAWWWLTVRARVSWRDTEYQVDRRARILHGRH